MSTKCDRTRQLWVEGEPPKVIAKLKRGVSGAPKSLPRFAPPESARDRMERVRLAIAFRRSARGPATSWAEVLVKNVHANLPKQWKAEIIFYEDGGDVEDEEDEKEDDGEVGEGGKRKGEREQANKENRYGDDTKVERVCEKSGECSERWERVRSLRDFERYGREGGFAIVEIDERRRCF